MVKVVLAVVEDSSAIELEAKSGGINSNRNWLLLDGGGKSIAVSFINLNVRGQWSILSEVGVLFALGLESLVRIVSSALDSVLEDIIVGPLDNSSIASHVSLSGRAINEFLFRVVDPGVVLDSS